MVPLIIKNPRNIVRFSSSVEKLRNISCL